MDWHIRLGEYNTSYFVSFLQRDGTGQSARASEDLIGDAFGEIAQKKSDGMGLVLKFIYSLIKLADLSRDLGYLVQSVPQLFRRELGDDIRGWNWPTGEVTEVGCHHVFRPDT
jgi:hypothetical protein